MRSGFIVTLVATVVFALVLQHYNRPCQLPVTYRVGDIDERFNLTADEAREVIARAEAVWEESLGQDLFVYNGEKGKLPINFVYDERQASAEAEFGFRERLDAAAEANNEIRAQYETLSKEYEALAASYETRVDAYDARLALYNNTVASYNEQGGAPPEVFAELEEEKSELKNEERELSSLARELNNFVDKLNQLGKQGNLLVERYNVGVGEYNQTFGESREFTQGDYRGDSINIYTFNNKEELALVLAHEFGHALGLEHVEGRESIMHYLIGEQPRALPLSEYDKSAFSVVCTEKSLWDRIVSTVR